MKNQNDLVLHATDIAKSVDSPFSLYCRYFVDSSERDPPDPYMIELANHGKDHESAYKQNAYPDATPIAFDTPEEGFMKTIQGMMNGSYSFLGMPLYYMPDGMHGFPDVLERRDGRSVFGKHHYVVKEVKLARNIKAHHIIQGAFYNKMIGRIQGHVPDVFYLVNMDGEESEYDFSDWKNTLEAAIEETTRIKSGFVPPAVYNSCKYPWSNYCNKMAIKAGDISLINGIGPKKRESFLELGIKTLDDLMRHGKKEVLAVNRVGRKTADKYLACAKAIKSGKPVRKTKDTIILPERQTEIFLDLEGLDAFTGEDLDQTDYLIGILVRDDGEKYIPFIAKSPQDEKRMLFDFLKFIKKQKDYAIYHWHSYERTHLKKMMDKYLVGPNMQNKVLSHKVTFDLHKIATSAFEFPVPGTGLKTIAKWMGFEWKHKQEVDAMNSINLYLQYSNDPKNNQKDMDLILDYNHDDCKATSVVKDWLAENKQA